MSVSEVDKEVEDQIDHSLIMCGYKLVGDNVDKNVRPRYVKLIHVLYRYTCTCINVVLLLYIDIFVKEVRHCHYIVTMLMQ